VAANKSRQELLDPRRSIRFHLSVIDSTEGRFGEPAASAPRRRRKDSAPPLAMPMAADRLPPHSIEAEQGVLGCILLSPNECMGMSIEKLKRGSEVFYDMRHQALFDVLAEMYDKKELIDPITVQQHLRDRNQLEALGGMPYIAGLMNCVPSAANLEYYLEIVREKWTLRKMIQTCTGAISRVYEHQGEVDALLDEVERDVLQISEERVAVNTRTIKDLVHKAINTIEDYHQRQGMLTGLGSGFPDLDKMTSGFHGGEMIVIAARPSMGKTSLAMNIAEHVAIEEKQPVGVFSLEMTSESLVLRMLCSRSRVNLRNIRDGFLAERDFPKLTGAAG
jgi:replicative DNA helicase